MEVSRSDFHADVKGVAGDFFPLLRLGLSETDAEDVAARAVVGKSLDVGEVSEALMSCQVDRVFGHRLLDFPLWVYKLNPAVTLSRLVSVASDPVGHEAIHDWEYPTARHERLASFGECDGNLFQHVDEADDFRFRLDDAAGAGKRPEV